MTAAEPPLTFGSLRVWWIPQVPGKPFLVRVADVAQAKFLLVVLAKYDQFQRDNKIKPDYCNTGGLEVYEEDAGEGQPGWCEWYNEDGDSVNEAR